MPDDNVPLEKMISRADLKKLEPQYDSLLAIDKLIMENNYGTPHACLRKKFQRSFTVVGSLLFPLGVYIISKDDPAFAHSLSSYVFDGVIGGLTGFFAGVGLGTLVSETVLDEGEINTAYKKVKKYFSS
ncbi:MAG: hypothetical protein KC535_00970 [Nanoarchaeota archaeon]|nr:hypothetical protein [Nanoarchaeota archaeon]